jgi:hypothetical protein
MTPREAARQRDARVKRAEAEVLARARAYAKVAIAQRVKAAVMLEEAMEARDAGRAALEAYELAALLLAKAEGAFA